MSARNTLPRETAAIRCPDCGGTRDVSVRQKRRLINQDGDLRCSVCRSIPDPAKFGPRDLDWWSSRFSQEWICETAEMIWGEDEEE